MAVTGSVWLRAEGCGLAARATVCRVEEVTKRMASELPKAVDEVAAMPAGRGIMLDVFARGRWMNAFKRLGHTPEKLATSTRTSR